MIVVATADFELYHGLVAELRDRDARFTTVEPGDPLPDGTSVLLTGPDDPPPEDPEIGHVVATPSDPRAAVEEALAAGRAGARRIVGIDPGTRPGIAVLAGEEIVAAFQVPLAEAADVVAREIEGTVDPLVRIGDGARLRGSRLIDALEGVRVELVDETGTTPHLGAGASGMGDVLAAVNIARREGDPVERREVEPTAGEIERIKETARERSGDNRAITGNLARRVARGDLTIEDALEEHRG